MIIYICLYQNINCILAKATVNHPQNHDFYGRYNPSPKGLWQPGFSAPRVLPPSFFTAMAIAHASAPRCRRFSCFACTAQFFWGVGHGSFKHIWWRFQGKNMEKPEENHRKPLRLWISVDVPKKNGIFHVWLGYLVGAWTSNDFSRNRRWFTPYMSTHHVCMYVCMYIYIYSYIHIFAYIYTYSYSIYSMCIYI